CRNCAAGLKLLPFPEFARLAGPAVMLTTDAAPDRAVGPDLLLPQLAAEAALLRARLDLFQERLNRLADP
ncbi:MAG: hypothetical protein QOI83_329, partial [Streptomycetaceae bacterium]|nr:hypothetical protein [Streptomycetaceae bacterium]